MKTDDILRAMEDKEFLDKLYRFSYQRCSTSPEAEDLCSDILLAILDAAHKQAAVEKFSAFVWTIARRTYADFCEKRRRESSRNISLENSGLPFPSEKNEIDTLIEETAAAAHMKKILAEIAFLSKAYRDVMILYYLDGKKVKDIAQLLQVSEATVKQRLFSARKTVKQEVETMNPRNLSLQPVGMAIPGTGNPCGNNPRNKMERQLSKNLVYLCKDKPKSARELSDELCVPMPYIEEELEIQCRGENGSYGMLRKLDNGKYTINVLVVDYSEYDAASRIFENYLPQICRLLGRTLEEKKEEILRFPYLSPQTDIRFILWALISRVFWGLKDDIHVIIKSRYFADIPPTSSRPFTCAAIAFDAGDEAGAPLFDFYGSDGIDASAVGGYRHVFVSNIYGKRLDRHFSCGHNLSHDAQLLLVLKAIGGLPIDRLTEAEKEIAAKCVACGYLRKQENRLEPKMIVIEREHADAFFSLSKRLQEPMQEIKEQIAEKLAGFMKQHIPKHLMSEYPFYIELIAGIRILSNAIEACIQNGLLQEPESRQGAEGMLMIVEK